MGVTGNGRDPDLLAAYALDAVDDDDALMIEATLATSADAAAEVSMLAHAAGEYGAAMVTPHSPHPALRARVLRAGLTSRPGAAVQPADARTVRRIEADRFAALLRQLTPEQWELPVDPPEFAGWTVRDLASHVAASEALTAQLLDVALATVPESDLGNESRTLLTQARHRTVPTDELVTEFEHTACAVTDALDGFDTEVMETTELTWWGAAMRLSTLCVSRAFETWTHADDIRRAVGRDALPPPAPSLATMSARAAEWTGLMLLLAGNDIASTRAILELTGAGGSTQRVELGLEPAPADARPAFTLRLDILEFCLALGRRAPTDGLRYQVEGDAELAADLINALPALAQL